MAFRRIASRAYRAVSHTSIKTPLANNHSASSFHSATQFSSPSQSLNESRPLLHTRFSDDRSSVASVLQDTPGSSDRAASFIMGTLKSELQDACLEWPPNQNNYYIPIDLLERLVVQKAVAEELQRDNPELLQDQVANYTDIICTKAKRVYTILLCMEKGDRTGPLLDEGITDADLPFVRSNQFDSVSTPQKAGVKFDLCTSSHFKTCLKHNHTGTGCGIKALESWPSRDIRNLSRDQWQVLSPIFEPNRDGSIPYMEFDDNVIFPFVEDHENTEDAYHKTGGYSHVFGVRVHSAHQKVYRSTDLNVLEPLLAIKRPHSPDQSEFKKEARMLSTLALGNHPHLVKLLATYKYKGQYHFMFPFANTNLRGYWNDTGLPNRNFETYLWFLRQLCGLTSGLNAIHNFKAQKDLQLDGTPTREGLNVTIGKYLTVAPAERCFGRHGDIKPENILWSNELEECGKDGILQITDMGLGRFHALESRSGLDAKGINGSPTYAPPEVATTQLVSRSYDIWSLACVFIEFTTWLIEGYESVERFNSSRFMEVTDGWYDDTYYTVITSSDGRKSAEVRRAVKDWFVHLKNQDRCSGMLKDVLNIVENRMLVAQSDQRIACDALVKELEEIQAHAEKAVAEKSLEYILGKTSPATSQELGVKLPKGSSTRYAPQSVAEPSNRLRPASPDIQLPEIVLSDHGSGFNPSQRPIPDPGFPSTRRQ